MPDTPMADTPQRSTVPPSSPPLSSTKKRKVQPREEHLLAGIENIVKKATVEEYTFVCNALHPETGEHKESLKLVAFMLQKNLFEKFFAMQMKDAQAAQEAPKLPEKVTRYENLTKPLLLMMIQAWESFAAEKKRQLERIPRDTLLKWVLFALNVKGHHELPKGEYRNIGAFLPYTRGRYRALFSRLECLHDKEDIKYDSVLGYFSIDPPHNMIKLNIKPAEGAAPLSFNHDFGGHDDWWIGAPFSVHARMISVKAGETKTLRTKLQASCGVSLPDPIPL